MDGFKEDGNPYHNMQQKFGKDLLQESVSFCVNFWIKIWTPTSKGVIHSWKKRYEGIIIILTLQI
jgi:hypothetical protein